MRWVLTVVVATAAVAVAGCNEAPGPVPADQLPNPANAAPISREPTPSVYVAPTGAPSLTADEQCRTAELKASLGPVQTAGTTRSQAVTVTDVGTRACAVQGAPRIQLVNAAKTFNPTVQTGSGTAVRVDLTPGTSAVTTLTWSVVPVAGATPTDCPASAYLELFPPGQDDLLFPAVSITACNGRLDVTAFTAA